MTKDGASVFIVLACFQFCHLISQISFQRFGLPTVLFRFRLPLGANLTPPFLTMHLPNSFPLQYTPFRRPATLVITARATSTSYITLCH
ncbi:unnamed protein product [Protopolystoma xenopodis]|uniref:Uncharacterized protein n=1 Tax=Protopolystoma xenopodis TaxID=117903 RepID=A0A3S5CG56_9PLAT|nr:unnamed protein product [Protopolystoma xenopodis]